MKDAYYFAHDSNAKDDPKNVLLIEQLGLEGYGIYWVLIETLRDQPEYKYPLALISALARRYNTTAEKMKAVVQGYGLFIIDEEDFFSESLIKRMGKLEEMRFKKSIAGKRGNDVRWGNLEESQCDRNAIPVQSQNIASKEKKSKVNESKENDIKTNIPYQEIVAHLNFRSGTQYKPTSRKTKECIRARWNEGFALEDFKTVIDKKCITWLNDPKMSKYLRPETLFGTKFESYLNEKVIRQEDKSIDVPKSWNALEQWKQMRKEHKDD